MADDGWHMPYKRCYHPKLARFMDFLHGRDPGSYDIHNCTFTRDQLLAITPTDIKRFFGLLAFNDPDYNVHPPANHRPTYCRAASLETYKKGLSYYMPHRTVPYVNGVGNPTRSAQVNDIINEIKKFEVRGEGCKSSAKRPIREKEFRKQLELLRAQPTFEAKLKYPFLLAWQWHLIGRLDDCANFELDDPRGHSEFEFALKTKVKWSKNVMEERRCPDQIILPSMDPEYCVHMNMAIYLEEFLRLHPNAKYLFTEDLDDKAPTRLKNNCRNAFNRHVYTVEEFLDLVDVDEEVGLGTHSTRKGAATEARRQGGLADEIEIRGRWKQNGRRVVFRYIDVQQLHIDAKIAGLLCQGGPIKYKLKASVMNRITDEWLFTHCVPHIRHRFPNDRRLCRALGLATLFAYCDPTLRDTRLTEFHRTRIAAGLDGLDYGDNCVERVPLHIYSVNGNLCIDEMSMGPQGGGGGNNGGGGGGGVGGAPMSVHGTTNAAVLQSILLAQQRCQQSISLLQVQVDNGFSAMKVWQQHRFVTLNDNVRRFGGTIQGGFARQDPVQASNRRRHQARTAVNDENAPNTPDDRNAELCPNLHTLEDLWEEYKFGIGNRKAASQFTQQERGGYGSNKKKQRYCRRNRIWKIMDRLVREGDSYQSAIRKIKVAYGPKTSVTAIMNAIGKYGVHPGLINGSQQEVQDAAARYAPYLSRGGRGGRNGPRVAALPRVRRTAPIFRGANVPRLTDGSAVLQNMLNNVINQRNEDGRGPIPTEATTAVD